MFFRKIFSKKTRGIFKFSLKRKPSQKNRSSYLFKLSLFFLALYPLAKALKNSLTDRASFLHRHKKLLFSLFASILLSDLLLVKSHHFLMPDKKLPPLKRSYKTKGQKLSPHRYKSIWENNIFHTGTIPLQLQKSSPTLLEPVLSSLPLKLKGTIIHANPRRSVATVTAGDGKVMSYQQGDIIDKQAEVRNIQRGKLIFFNLDNNQLEYILLPEEKLPFKITHQKENKKPSLAVANIVKKVGPNHFQVTRSDMLDYLHKLPEILRQARMEMRLSKKTGEPEYYFASINKGSIFEKLGFQKGDAILEVDGELISGPEHALALYERLKARSNVKVLVSKNGKEEYYEYSVRENAPNLIN